MLSCLWWVSNLNVGQNSFITKSITWSSIIQIFNKLPPNLNLNLCFILRLIFCQSWIDWIRYFSMISLIFQHLNIYTLDASISILIIHFWWGQSPNFDTFIVWSLSWWCVEMEGNQWHYKYISSYAPIFYWVDTLQECKVVNRCVNCCGELE